jgi:hypothetical protein
MTTEFSQAFREVEHVEEHHPERVPDNGGCGPSETQRRVGLYQDAIATA